MAYYLKHLYFWMFYSWHLAAFNKPFYLNSSGLCCYVKLNWFPHLKQSQRKAVGETGCNADVLGCDEHHGKERPHCQMKIIFALYSEPTEASTSLRPLMLLCSVYYSRYLSLIKTKKKQHCKSWKCEIKTVHSIFQFSLFPLYLLWRHNFPHGFLWDVLMVAIIVVYCNRMITGFEVSDQWWRKTCRQYKI